MFIVQECRPFMGFSKHTYPQPRFANVQSPNDALALPWIKGLPGEKKLAFIRGQLFIVQVYLGSKLARAQIDHTYQSQQALDGPNATTCGESVGNRIPSEVLETTPPFIEGLRYSP